VCVGGEPCALPAANALQVLCSVLIPPRTASIQIHPLRPFPLPPSPSRNTPLTTPHIIPPPARFGKRLAAEAARRWGEHYVDYKAIKRAIKDDIGNAGGWC
jgi:hypothetical protein